MKKMCQLFVFVAMAAVLFSGTAWAGQAEAMPIVGYEKSGLAVGAPFIAFGPVGPTAYEVTIKSPVAVFDQEFSGAKMLDDTARKGKKVWVATYAENPSLFEGATLHAIPLGENWPGDGKSLAKIRLNEALASAQMVNGTAHFQFPRLKTEGYWQSLTWVIRLADGTLGWGGHPGYPNGEFLIYNKNNSPLTVWGVMADRIVVPTQKVREFFKTRL